MIVAGFLRGVPQDCILRPVLFTMFTTDFSECVITQPLYFFLSDIIKSCDQFPNQAILQNDLLKLQCGIPQGCILGPQLFTEFTPNFSNCVKNLCTFFFISDITKS